MFVFLLESTKLFYHPSSEQWKNAEKNKLEEDLVVWISTEISDKLLMDFSVNFAKDI